MCYTTPSAGGGNLELVGDIAHFRLGTEFIFLQVRRKRRQRRALRVDEHAALRRGHEKGVKQHAALRREESRVLWAVVEFCYVRRDEALHDLARVRALDGDHAA